MWSWWLLVVSCGLVVLGIALVLVGMLSYSNKLNAPVFVLGIAIFLVGCILFAIFIASHYEAQRRACTQKGGAYVDSQCLKVSKI